MSARRHWTASDQRSSPRQFLLNPFDEHHGRNLGIVEKQALFKQGASTDEKKLWVKYLPRMCKDAAAGSRAKDRCQANRRHLQRSDAAARYFEPP